MSITGKSINQLRELKRESIEDYGMTEEAWDKTLYGQDLKLQEAWINVGKGIADGLNESRIGRWFLRRFFPSLEAKP